MVDRDYLAGGAPRPSSAKIFLDQTMLPRLIDAAACGERMAACVAASARRTPVACFGLALGAGVAAGLAAALCRCAPPRRGKRR